MAKMRKIVTIMEEGLHSLESKVEEGTFPNSRFVLHMENSCAQDEVYDCDKMEVERYGEDHYIITFTPQSSSIGITSKPRTLVVDEVIFREEGLMRRDCEKRNVYEEVKYYHTPSRSCTLTKNRCCAPYPRDGPGLNDEYDCRTCNVPLLFALKGTRDDLMKVCYDIVERMEEKE